MFVINCCTLLRNFLIQREGLKCIVKPPELIKVTLSIMKLIASRSWHCLISHMYKIYF